MKKLMYSLVAFALVFFGAANVNAQENAIGNDEKVEVAKSPKKIEVKSKEIKASGTKFNMFSSFDQKSISVSRDKYNNYRLGKDIVNGRVNPLNNGDIELKYSEQGVELISTYRYINNTYGYAHISNEIKDKNTRYSIKYNFHYIAKLTSNDAKTSFEAGNCTSGYKIKSADGREYTDSSMKTIKERFIQSYQIDAFSVNHYTSIDQYGLVNGKLVRKLRLEAPRKKGSKQVTNIKKIYYYTNGKMKNYTNYRSLGYTSDPSKFTYKAHDLAAYNGRSQLTSLKRISHYKSWNGKKYVKYNVIHTGTYRTYHKNARLKTNQVSKKNSSNKYTSIKKTTYRGNGKKYSYVNRSYKGGKAKSHTLYRYNAKGNTKGSGAYKVNVSFNKKGKATSAKKAKYKKNGKLNKAKRVKVTKSLYKI
ncbi:MAG: hypothetical protein RR425_01725 [Erysipelotrichales bacterium]